jgi:hypothetical protein
MDRKAFSRNDWIAVATLAHMVLSQAISDELLDELVSPAPLRPVQAYRAA